MKEYIKCIIVTAKGNKIPHVCMYLSWFSVCVQYPLQLQKKKKKITMYILKHMEPNLHFR